MVNGGIVALASDGGARMGGLCWIRLCTSLKYVDGLLKDGYCHGVIVNIFGRMRCYYR